MSALAPITITYSPHCQIIMRGFFFDEHQLWFTKNCVTATKLGGAMSGISTRLGWFLGMAMGSVIFSAMLSKLYRHSTRMVQSAMQNIFGISMFLGTVNKLRLEASNAVESAVSEAKIYVQNSPVVNPFKT